MPVIGTPVITASGVTFRHKITEVYGQQILPKIQTIAVVQGQAVAIETVLRNDNGSPLDLSNFTDYVITFRISEVISGGAETKTDINGFIVDAAGGVVVATLTSAVVEYAGISYVEVAFQDSAYNVVFSNKFYLMVEYGQFGAATRRQGPPTRQEVRLALRDNAPADNYLLDEVEFDDAEIAQAIIRPIEQFNGMGPPINITFNTASFPFRFQWLEGILYHLYMVAAAHYRRNHLPYSAAGVSVDDKNKERQYLQAAMLHKQNWDTFAKLKKVEMNIDSGFGSILSPYSSYDVYGIY